MIHHPKQKFCGLTIILDKPSRFDLDAGKLISGFSGTCFENFLFPINRDSCEIRTLDEGKIPIREDSSVILGLGEGCIGTLSSKENSLNEVRGYPLSYQGRRLILSYAPQDAYDRRDYTDPDDLGNDSGGYDNIKGHGKTRRRNRRWWMMSDIRRAVQCLNPKKDIEIGSYEQHIGGPIMAWLIDMLKNLKDNKLYLDIETDKDKNLTCLGLGFNNKVFVVPFKKYNRELYYSKEPYNYFFQALIIAMNNNTVVVHNGMFDLYVLSYFYKIPIPRKIIDTMLIWHRMYPELEKSLGHLLSYLTWLPYHKSEGIYNPKNSDQDKQLWEYNAKDIIAMMELLPRLLKESNENASLTSGYFSCSMIRPYLTMMYKGMLLDTEKMKARYDNLSLKREQLDRCLRHITKINLNPRSPKQVKEYLYTRKGLNYICLNDEAPTNEKTLLKTLTLDDKTTIPSIRIILASRRVGKTASSLKYNLYHNKFDNVDEPANRLTTAYNLAGTDTFRLSSRALLKFKTDKGFGTNVQNQDKNQRDLVIADKDKVLIQVDQAGAEALIVAYLCRKAKYRDLFENNIKPHSFVALHVFKDKWRELYKNPDEIDYLCKLPIKELKNHQCYKEVFNLIKSSDDWPAKECYYFIAKMICHASNYNMKAPTFQMNVLQRSDGAINFTVKQCAEFLGMYHLLFPEIREWHEDVKRELKRTRTLINLFDEPRKFFDYEGEDLWKQGFAFIPQSTVGEITNRAIVRLQGLIDDDPGPYRDMGFDLLQNGHDSILAQCYNKPGIISVCVNLIKSCLEVDLVSPKDETKFKMKSEASIGFNWGPFKGKSNPHGMMEYATKS